MVDISIDLETFSSEPGAAIATIGAAAADFEGVLYDVNPEFYAVVNDPTGLWDPRTIRWHTTQADPVGNVGRAAQALGLPEALKRFGSWLRDLGADVEGEARIWTHATFDMPILQAAYNRADVWRPWHYRNCRDLRTLYDLAGGRPEVQNDSPHNALADAIAQLEEVRIGLTDLGVL